MEMRILRLKSSKAKKYFVEMTTDCQTPQYGKVPLCTHTKKNMCIFVYICYFYESVVMVRISDTRDIYEKNIHKRLYIRYICIFLSSLFYNMVYKLPAIPTTPILISPFTSILRVPH